MKMRTALTTLIVTGFILALTAGGHNGAAQAATSRQYVWTSKKYYAAGEQIVVRYSGLAGSRYDVIDILQNGRGLPSFWKYTGGRRSGYITFGALRRGTYDARVRFVLNGRAYSDTHRFHVRGSGSRQYVWTSKKYYAADEQIVVRYSGLAGSRYDVIEILQNGRGISGYWQYTKSRRSGYVKFRGLRRGTYDARVRFVLNGRSYSDKYRFYVGYSGNGSGNGGGGGVNGGSSAQSVCRTFRLGQAICSKWTRMGGSSSVLGNPITGERQARRSTQGTSGRSVQLRNGFLVLHTTGRYRGRVFEVHGPAYYLYTGMRGSVSWLGFPVSDVYRVSGGERINFEGGYIFINARTGRAKAYRYR